MINFCNVNLLEKADTVPYFFMNYQKMAHGNLLIRKLKRKGNVTNIII